MKSCWRRCQPGSSPRVSKGVIPLRVGSDTPSLTVGLLHTHNPPVVVRFSRNCLVFFDPVDDQLANFRARFVDNLRILEHCEAAAAVDAIVIRDDAQFLSWR